MALSASKPSKSKKTPKPAEPKPRESKSEPDFMATIRSLKIATKGPRLVAVVTDDIHAAVRMHCFARKVDVRDYILELLAKDGIPLTGAKPAPKKAAKPKAKKASKKAAKPKAKKASKKAEQAAAETPKPAE